MARVSSRRLKTARDLLIAGGIFTWALFHTPDSIPEKSGELLSPKASHASITTDGARASASASGTSPAAARAKSAEKSEPSVFPKPGSADAVPPEAPPVAVGIPGPTVPGSTAGNADVSHPRAVRNSILPTAIQKRAETRMSDIMAAAPREPVKSPVAFAIPETGVPLDPLEEEVIHTAQQSFADEMKSAPVNDPASHEYASHWQRAVEAHDDYLRRMLGWDKFNQLSALAGQRSYAESGVVK